jgi:hypothetical protein
MGTSLKKTGHANLNPSIDQRLNLVYFNDDTS